MRRFPEKKSTLLPSLENPHYKPVSSAQVVPDKAVVLDDLLSVIWRECGRIKKKQEAALTLDPKEVRALTQLADAAAKLTKEQREQEKVLNPSELSDEEYLEKLKEAVRALELKIQKKKPRNENEG